MAGKLVVYNMVVEKPILRSGLFGASGFLTASTQIIIYDLVFFLIATYFTTERRKSRKASSAHRISQI